MATVNKIFTFDSGNEGFTLTETAGGGTISRDTTNGSPTAGSIEQLGETGRNKAGEGQGLIDNGTWESIFGVPAGSTVNSLTVTQIRTYAGLTAWTAVDNVDFSLHLLDSTNTTPVLSGVDPIYVRNVTAQDSGWNQGSASAQNVSASYQASNTQLDFYFHINTNNANNPSAQASGHIDYISITVDYTAGETTYTGSFTANAVIEKAQSGSLTADAVIEAPQAGSFTADASLVVTHTGDFTADAIIAATAEGSLAADAVVFATVSDSLAADAIIGVLQTGSFTTDSIVLVPTEASTGVDAILFSTTVDGHNADAIVLATRSGSFSADASIAGVGAGDFTADASIAGGTTGAFTSDAVLGLVGRCVWVSPANLSGMPATPTLVFRMPDAARNMHFQIELDTDSGFSDPTVVQSPGTGWEYWDGGGWQPIPDGGVPNTYSGNEARYTVQSPLSQTTWYRRVRAGVI